MAVNFFTKKKDAPLPKQRMNFTLSTDIMIDPNKTDEQVAVDWLDELTNLFTARNVDVVIEKITRDGKGNILDLTVRLERLE